MTVDEKITQLAEIIDALEWWLAKYSGFPGIDKVFADHKVWLKQEAKRQAVQDAIQARAKDVS